MTAQWYRRIVTLVFPVFLICAERVVRYFANSEATKFLAPTLLSVALGLLFPLLAPEDRTKQLPKDDREQAAGTVTYNRADEILRDIANVLVYFFSFVWVLFLFLSLRPGAPEDPTIGDCPTWIYAVGIYIFCAGMAEIKEHL